MLKKARVLNGIQKMIGHSPETKTFANRFVLLLLITAAIFSATIASAAKSIRKDKVVINGIEIEIENFGKVLDTYYRGAQPEEDEYQQLAAIGVKTVVDLRDDPKEYAKNSAEKAGLKYINLPMSDKDFPAADAPSKFLSVVNLEENQPVYVHCAGGRHRTGAMTAVYRMTMQGWDVEHAYDEMKDYDFYTRWGHKSMKTFVFAYYRELQQKRNSPSVNSHR